jgi:hypothetical protein
MTQPDKIHPGRLNLNPILAKKTVTISIGQIMHQTLPRKTADNTTTGHQSLHTKLVVRLVLLSILIKKGSSEGEVKPMMTRKTNAMNVRILKETGNHLNSNSLLIILNIG